MKPLIHPVLLLPLVAASSIAWSAGKEGGGGAAVVCRDAQNRVKSPVKVLDLYQYEITGELIPERTNEPVDAQIERAIGRLKGHYVRHDLTKRVASVRAKWKMLAENLNLYKKYDLGSEPILIEDGCEPQWVAYDNDQDKVTVVTNLYRRMAPTDQAALILHEAIYEIDREKEGAGDSARTRALVAHLFARGTAQERIDELAGFLDRDSPYGDANTLVVDRLPTTYSVLLTAFAKPFFPRQDSYHREWALRLTCADADGLETSTVTPWQPIAPSQPNVVSLSITGNCRYFTVQAFAGGENLLGPILRFSDEENPGSSYPYLFNGMGTISIVANGRVLRQDAYRFRMTDTSEDRFLAVPAAE